MSTLSRTGWLARLEDARDFFTRRVWETRLDELPGRRALGYRVARLGYCAARGLLFSDRLHVRAAALTYYTVLSLVPLLAFAFALLKGFGAYDAIIDETVRPYLLETFAGNPALHTAFDQVLSFVERTSVASLGVVGLLFLLYSATRLLRNIEGALNELWEARSPRTPLQQLRDYVAIIVVTPLCLMLATAVATFSQLIDLLRSLQERLGVGELLEWSAGTLGPLFVAFTGLVFLYRIMPNTPVRTRSAVIGAVVGGALWYLALVLHVRFQVGVARFNALYAGFGAIPIFLVWLHVSWLTVMVGAEIASTHQHERASLQRRRAAEASQALREALCLSAMLRVARALYDDEEPPTQHALAAELDVPEPLIAELMGRMADARLVHRSGRPGDPRWLLARLPGRIRVKDVLDALHGTSPEERQRIADLHGMHPAVGLLRRIDEELAATAANRTLHDLLGPEQDARREA